MKNNNQSIIARLSRNMAGIIIWPLLLLSSAVAFAQNSVEKSESSQQSREADSELDRAKILVNNPSDTKPEKPETGMVWSVYSMTTTFEIGHRFVDTDGSLGRYLSDVDVRPGFRLLEYSTEMRARPGTGLLFDFLKAQVENAGGDQSQTFTLRMDKTRYYNFDASVRRFNYYDSPGPNFALGYRNYDLRQQVSDFKLKLFPQRAVRVNIGYDSSMAKGSYNPTYTYERDIFQLDGQARWRTNDYHLGVDATHRSWNFSFEQSYRNYRNDPTINSTPGVNLGFAATDAATITFLNREIPLRSHDLVSRASLQGRVGERLHIVVRALRDDERMRAPYLEDSQGTASNSSTIISRVLTGDGVANRPGDTVDAGATFDLNKNFSINDSFSYSSFRILGDVTTLQPSLQQLGRAAPQTIITTADGDQVTKWDSYMNTLSLDASFGKRFSANLGWRAMLRDINLNTNFISQVSSPPSVTTTVTNEGESATTHAFVGGFRVRPKDRFSFMFDVEHGTSDNIFVRLDPLEYTRFRLRAQVQATDKLSLTGAFTSTDNHNPTPQVQDESKAKSYAVSVDWEPKSRISLDAGYDYNDLYSAADILYFIANTMRSGKALYFARLNSVFFNTRFELTKRLDLIMVYYYIMDRGAPPITVGPNDLVSAYPLHRHNPEVRLAYRFNNHISGNISYRHYSYNERDFDVEDYRANILTTSLRFTF